MLQFIIFTNNFIIPNVAVGCSSRYFRVDGKDKKVERIGLLVWFVTNQRPVKWPTVTQGAATMRAVTLSKGF